MGKSAAVTIKSAKPAPPVKKTAAIKKAKANGHAPGVKVEEEAVDSRGRRIGKRGLPRVIEGGMIQISAEERTVLRSLAARSVSGGKVSAWDRAQGLEVGEHDVALGETMQSFAMALAMARRNDTLDGRDFNYVTGIFSPGVGLPAVSVLWIQRTA